MLATAVSKKVYACSIHKFVERLIKYITALFATFSSSDRYHKYGLVEEWTLLEGLSKTNVRATFLEDVTGKVH